MTRKSRASPILSDSPISRVSHHHYKLPKARHFTGYSIAQANWAVVAKAAMLPSQSPTTSQPPGGPTLSESRFSIYHMSSTNGQHSTSPLQACTSYRSRVWCFKSVIVCVSELSSSLVEQRRSNVKIRKLRRSVATLAGASVCLNSLRRHARPSPVVNGSLAEVLLTQAKSK